MGTLEEGIQSSACYEYQLLSFLLCDVSRCLKVNFNIFHSSVSNYYTLPENVSQVNRKGLMKHAELQHLWTEKPCSCIC